MQIENSKTITFSVTFTQLYSTVMISLWTIAVSGFASVINAWCSPFLFMCMQELIQNQNFDLGRIIVLPAETACKLIVIEHSVGENWCMQDIKFNIYLARSYKR